MLPGDVLASSFHPDPLPEVDGSWLGEKEVYALPTLLLLNQGGYPGLPVQMRMNSAEPVLVWGLLGCPCLLAEPWDRQPLEAGQLGMEDS